MKTFFLIEKNRLYWSFVMQHKDQQYIDALLNNDSVLIQEIYTKFAPQCKRFIEKNNGDAQKANDIFQESLIYVFRKAKTKYFELSAPFGGYLYFVYRGKWLDELKKKGVFNLRIDDIDLYTDDTTTYLKELKYMIYKACYDKLSDTCKEILGARFLKIGAKELAEELQIEPNAADQRMYYCRESLKKCIEQHSDFKKLNT